MTFESQGDSDLYGYNVTARNGFLPSVADRSWIDIDTLLPEGVITRFYLSTDTAAVRLDAHSRVTRLQIWRPVNVTTNQLQFTFVHQQRVYARCAYCMSIISSQSTKPNH